MSGQDDNMQFSSHLASSSANLHQEMSSSRLFPESRCRDDVSVFLN